MARWLILWLRRVIVVLAAVVVCVYLADWSIYKLRGAPGAKVSISRYVAIPLKGGRQEFVYLGSSDMPCAQALFPQGSLSPCWQLRRNTNQGLTP